MGVLGTSAEQKIFAGLTDKQRVFVLEYAAELNSTRAAREAGYRNPNVMGAKLLKAPKIQRAIRALLKPKLDEIGLTVENVLRQLSRFLFRNIAPFCDADGYLACSPKDLPDDIQQCIDSWEVERDYHKDGELLSEKIRVHCVSKVGALTLAMKYLKLLPPNQTNSQVNVNGFDWKAFYAEAQEPVVDTIDLRLKEIAEHRVE
jgi:hypothetical protein